MSGLPPEVVAFIEAQDQKIAALEERNRLLRLQVEQQAEQIRALQKVIYAPKSEKAKYICPEGFTQDTLFDEAEVCVAADPEPTEPKIISIPAHTRKPKRTKDELAKTLPVVEVLHTTPESERSCNICANQMQPIGKELVRQELSIIPAQAFVTHTYRENYACHTCEAETDEANIVKAKTPEAVVKRGLAAPSAVAYTMYQKYVNAMPLYRQEKDWLNFGVKISRATLANWIIYTANRWLAPLWSAMKDILLLSQLIYADETVVQVLSEPGKTPQSKSRMWVYATGNPPPDVLEGANADGTPRIILYDYQPDRAGENARRFLTVDHPFYLHTDGYEGYNGVANAVRVGCWAHARRKWNEAMPKSPPKDNPAYIGLRYCQKLFELERKYAESGMSPDERLAARREHSKPVAEAYYAWLENDLRPLAGSKLAIAATYAKNQKAELMMFLETGLVELSTNYVENAIRPFAVGRKNWLFADSVAGATASAVIYSIIETAKANALNPYEYLLLLFTELPQVLAANPLADLAPFFPWTPGISDRCRILKSALHSSLA